MNKQAIPQCGDLFTIKEAGDEKKGKGLFTIDEKKEQIAVYENQRIGIFTGFVLNGDGFDQLDLDRRRHCILAGDLSINQSVIDSPPTPPRSKKMKKGMEKTEIVEKEMNKKTIVLIESGPWCAVSFCNSGEDTNTVNADIVFNPLLPSHDSDSLSARFRIFGVPSAWLWVIAKRDIYYNEEILLPYTFDELEKKFKKLIASSRTIARSFASIEDYYKGGKEAGLEKGELSDEEAVMEIENTSRRILVCSMIHLSEEGKKETRADGKVLASPQWDTARIEQLAAHLKVPLSKIISISDTDASLKTNTYVHFDINYGGGARAAEKLINNLLEKKVFTENKTTEQTN